MFNNPAPPAATELGRLGRGMPRRE